MVILELFFIIVLLININQKVKATSDIIPWTNKQVALHEAADILRSAGYSDDSEVIKALSEQWWEEYNDLQMIAKTIFKEAGGCTWDHMVYVGAVVINRVNSQYFPNTVYDVLVQPLQYSQNYVSDFEDIPYICYEAAITAMNGEHDAPEDLYWQAQFPQGKIVWKVFEVDTGYYQSTTYFCREAYYD